MAKQAPSALLHPHVAAILRETGEDDPYTAVRIKARAVVAQYGPGIRPQFIILRTTLRACDPEAQARHTDPVVH